MTHPLALQLVAFIQHGTDSDAQFNQLALALFAYQYEQSAPLRRLWDAQNATPGTVTHWATIPAVPVAAFKRFALTCVPEADIVAEFHSSGTTGANTSRHLLGRDALDLYEASLRVGYKRALPDAPRPLWAVMPSPHEAPHSSLSHMLGTLGASGFIPTPSALHAAPPPSFARRASQGGDENAGIMLWNEGRDSGTYPLPLEGRVVEWSETGIGHLYAGIGTPLTFFGTAFAFAALMDDPAADLRLPPGSIVVETGGFKGRTREIERGTFYQMLSERFGVPVEHIHSEYGMCEMASQFYSHGLDDTKRGPHWVRTRAINTDTGEDAAPGEPGLLRHLDLANFNSALCVQTQDRGVLTPDGFVLLGRAPDAEVRGCSLTAEEMWT